MEKSSAPIRTRKAVVHGSLALAAIFFIGACSTEISGSATTIVPVGPTDFQTIPPVETTLPNIVTTLPPGSVGVEQTYTVRQGDSPILVANLLESRLPNCWHGTALFRQHSFRMQVRS